jgi:hypothetical protein
MPFLYRKAAGQKYAATVFWYRVCFPLTGAAGQTWQVFWIRNPINLSGLITFPITSIELVLPEPFPRKSRGPRQNKHDLPKNN